MPYFVILPAFALALFAEGLGVGLCAVVPRLRSTLPCAWRMLVGSMVGFVTANLGSILLGVVPVLVANAAGVDRDHPLAPVVAGCVLLGMFFGPLVVSPLGFVGGAWVGWRSAKRVERVASQMGG